MSGAPISVVVPAYNRKETIVRCLTSIFKQQDCPSEVIVVDDCSTDGTPSVISENFPNVRLIRSAKNQGAQVARNRGIEEATQPWICFLDSDDEWMPGKITIQWSELERLGFANDIVLHSNCVRNENGKDSLWDLPETEGVNARHLVLQRPAPMFQGMLLSKELIQSIGGLDDNVPSYQEWETSIRLTEKCRLFHNKAPLFRYHFHQGPTISKDAAREAVGYSYVVRKHEKSIRSELGEPIWKSHMLNLAKIAIIGGRFDLANDAAREISKSAEKLVSSYIPVARAMPSSRKYLAKSLSVLKIGRKTQNV